MHYLYPPLVDITNMPSEEVIEYCMTETVKQRFARNEITKEVHDLKLYNIKNKIREVEPVREITEDLIEELTEEEKTKLEELENLSNNNELVEEQLI